MSEELGPETRARNAAVRECEEKGIRWSELSAYEQLALVNDAYDRDMVARGFDPMADD